MQQGEERRQAGLLLHQRKPWIGPRVADARSVHHQLAHDDRPRWRAKPVRARRYIHVRDDLRVEVGQVLVHAIIERELASSTSISAATEVMGLVIEAMRKIDPRFHRHIPAYVLLPNASWYMMRSSEMTSATTPARCP